MTINVHKKYGRFQVWSDWPPTIHSIKDIKSNQELVSFRRIKNSHKGINDYKNIKKLIAHSVDQGFLDEIAKLKNLEYLYLDTITAHNLSSLKNLNKLKILKLEGVRKAKSFKPLLEIKSLTSLFIENAKHLSDLEVFSNAHNLVALGVEGSMWTMQKIPTLKPLDNLKNLEALFMSSVQLKDKNLTYLKSNKKLYALECSRFAPKHSFTQLREFMPNLQCNWCDNYEIEEQ
ncbi:MAG: hypothetical protein COA79_21640 [Planctomycetota bacterium]|nr:MAG: hypothetical protein COA79_21640 [Planctomycetota bacterium]